MYAHYDITNSIGVDVQERYRSKLKWTADATQYSIGGVPSAAYTNATLSYTISHSPMEFNFYVNVQNVFDKQPAAAPNPANAIFAGITPLYIPGDDVAGRYWTVGARARF